MTKRIGQAAKVLLFTAIFLALAVFWNAAEGAEPNATELRDVLPPYDGAGSIAIVEDRGALWADVTTLDYSKTLRLTKPGIAADYAGETFYGRVRVTPDGVSVADDFGWGIELPLDYNPTAITPPDGAGGDSCVCSSPCQAYGAQCDEGEAARCNCILIEAGYACITYCIEIIPGGGEVPTD